MTISYTPTGRASHPLFLWPIPRRTPPWLASWHIDTILLGRHILLIRISLLFRSTPKECHELSATNCWHMEYRDLSKEPHLHLLNQRIFAIQGVPKMALPVPELKIRDHFYKANTPPKRRTNHFRIAFLSLESVLLAISFILHILSRFQSVKTPSTRNEDSARKECSNQKVEENKPALKFNFTQEYNWNIFEQL